MRQCVKCNEMKNEELFPKRGNDCKLCVANYMKEYREKHAKRIAALKKQWKQQHLAYVKIKDKEYAQKNADKKQKARLKWREANPLKDRESKQNYAKTNPDKVKQANIQWSKNNPDKRRAGYSKRRATKRNATPKWISSEEWFLIREAYHLAMLREDVTGFKWHVDHIVPLQHSLVCGLHTPENLQVISAIANAKKGNKYEFM